MFIHRKLSLPCRLHSGVSGTRPGAVLTPFTPRTLHAENGSLSLLPPQQRKAQACMIIIANNLNGAQWRHHGIDPREEASSRLPSRFPLLILLPHLPSSNPSYSLIFGPVANLVCCAPSCTMPAVSYCTVPELVHRRTPKRKELGMFSQSARCGDATPALASYAAASQLAAKGL
jgi:hypothetical protein